MRQFFSTASWLVPIALLPLMFMTVLSQNTVPGDMLYGYKRGLETVIVLGASVHPTTRAMFGSNLADRRFDEVEKVIIARQDTTGLSEFVFTVAKAAENIENVEDVEAKAQLQQEFKTSLQDYQQKIQEIRTVYVRETVTQERVIVQEREVVREVEVPVQQQPPPPPQPTNTPVPVPTSRPGQPPVPTNTPVPVPTSTPTPQPTVPIIIPTATPVVLPPQPPGTPPGLSEVQEWLRCMEENNNNLALCPIPASVQAHFDQQGGNPFLRPTPTPTRFVAPTVPVRIPTATPTPRGRQGGTTLFNEGPGEEFEPAAPPPTATPIPPTPAPSCFVYGWNGGACSMPGGAECSDFGNASYCGWSESAWQYCNSTCPRVQGVSTENVGQDTNTFLEVIDWLFTPSIQLRVEGFTLNIEGLTK